MKYYLIFPMVFSIAAAPLPPSPPNVFSGSGSSGGGSAFEDCPEAPLQPTVGYVGEGHSTVRANLPDLDVMLPLFVTGEDLVMTLAPSMVLNSLTLVRNPRTNDYTLEVETEEVAVGDRVQVNVTLTIIDMMMVVLDTCAFTVEVSYVSEGICDVAQEMLSRLPVQTTLQSIEVIVNGQANEGQIRAGFAAVLNAFCPGNPVETCEQCAMTSICDVFLGNCQNFTDQNIIVLSISNNNQRRRQTDGTVVTLAAQVPEGAPQEEGSSSLISSGTLVQAAQQEMSRFTAVTGLTVLSVQKNEDFEEERIDFRLVAIIVLPIVVCAVVITLIVGIIAVIVVAIVLKHKRKTREGVVVRREVTVSRTNKVTPAN